MRLPYYFACLVGLIFIGCRADTASSPKSTTDITTDTIAKVTPYQAAVENPYIEFKGLTVESRFNLPEGYTRVAVEENAFAEYLRQLPLKTPGALVNYFNGATKPNDNIYEAVVDLPIGDKDLHQCADAIMRLRAEHLWFQQRYEDIHFKFTNGHQVNYTEWMKGRRMRVNGNKTEWDDGNKPSNTFNDLWNYLELIFTYAGTASLSKELQKVPLEKLSIGNIFIQGGSPGHAVIVVDLATHDHTDEKIFLLAQSYMPAQETQILTNRGGKLGPWYSLEPNASLHTPEWEFSPSDLLRFPD